MDTFLSILPAILEQIPNTRLSAPARTTLLVAGKVADKLFVIVKGAARMWFNQDGKDVTLQFFFEGSPVCSFESFLKEVPSEFNIETIEPTEIIVLDKKDLLAYGKGHPKEKEAALLYLTDRMINYTHLFLSRIKDTPEQRYKNLLAEHPEILQRVPQHYIASYLGITPVSLSRIRARK